MSVFVDTNVFLRFLTQDDAGQSSTAEQLFRDAAAGKIHLVTGPPVLFELAWTLKRSYDMPMDGVLSFLEAVVSLPGLDLLDRPTVHAALACAREQHLDFADAYILASIQVQELDGLATFNQKHFRKAGIKLLP